MSLSNTENLTWFATTFVVWNAFSLFICLTGLGLERARRRSSPLVRSSLLRVTLLLTLAAPIGYSVWSSIDRLVTAVPPVTGVSSQSTDFQTSNLDWQRLAVWRPAVSNLIEETRSSLVFTDRFSEIFLGLSLFGSVVLLTRLGAGVWALATFSKNGLSLELSKLSRCQSIAAEMRLPEPTLLSSELLESPILTGLLRPVILVPAGLELRDEIFFHELTHFRRHDLWWRLVVSVTTVLMPLQPGLWWLKRAMESCDEEVCDDAVLIAGADRETYARLLLEVAESQAQLPPELCLQMACFHSNLSLRLAQLLDTRRTLTNRLCLWSFGLRVTPLLLVFLGGGLIYIDSARLVLADASTQTATSKSSSTPGLEAKDIILASRKAYDSLTSYESTVESTDNAEPNKYFIYYRIREQRPDLYRFSWHSSTAGSSTATEWSDGSGRHLNQQASRDLKVSRCYSSGVSTLTISGESGNLGEFESSTWEHSPLPASLQRMPDEVVENVDCDVVLEDWKGPKTTLWIGKSDHLVHKIQLRIGNSLTSIIPRDIVINKVFTLADFKE